MDRKEYKRRWLEVARLHRMGYKDHAIAMALDMNIAAVERVLERPMRELREVAEQLGETL